MKGLIGLVAVVTLVGLVGCQSGPTIVGKWTGTGGVVGASSGTGEFEFKGDKTFVMTSTGEGTTFKMSGTYTTGEKGAFTMKVVDAGIEGELPPEAKAMKPVIDQMMEQVKGQETKGTVEFKSNDEATLTFEGQQPVTMTRVKG